MRILIIEDDDRIADFLARVLKVEGHSTIRLANGKDAVNTVKNGDFEFIILDLMLPGVSGLEVCQELRFRKINIPIIMLTAMDGIEDVVSGLRMGADDYMTKPFEIDELLARIETVGRRHRGIDTQSNVLSVADVQMDIEAKTVSRGDKTIDLTAKEFAILELLLSYPDKLFSRERILNNVWGVNTDPLTNVVDVYIGRLRKKLSEGEAPFIETVRGMGYRINTKTIVT